MGNIYEYPGFASLTDYRLMSQAGRWDDIDEIWVYDSVTSRCIDAGDPRFSLGDEYSHADNIRINMGFYGGTAQASKSPSGWSIISDVTNDGIVDFEDFAWTTKCLCPDEIDTGDDSDSGQQVCFDDISIIFENWLQQTDWY
jgi:hypothetical protein